MPTRNSKSAHANLWPELEDSYVDEFGPIDRAVYEIAPRLWPIAVALILRTIQDVSAGHRLMMKAVALVSRKVQEQPERMTSLHGYLFRTFSHLVSEELEKETKHGQLGLAHTQARAAAKRSDSDVFSAILLQEVLSRADEWTREVAEMRVLGHTFDEIGRKYGMEGNYVRSKWSKGIARLAETIKMETEAAERKILQRDRERP